jgi:transcriptional regulator
MHPNPLFRTDDRALMEALMDEVGLGMVFLTTPDGPRVAHVPLIASGSDKVQFHIARGNALARHLDGGVALAVINGPDAYVSPRWYADGAEQVPTWNYVALEMEGRVRKLDRDELLALLAATGARGESRIADGDAWTLDKLPPPRLAKMLEMIVGFEMEIAARRPTLKLSQNKPPQEREGVAAGLERAGSTALAGLMRGIAA